MSIESVEEWARDTFDSENQAVRVAVSSLVPAGFDEVDLTYTGDDPTTIIYKKDGVTIATLTLTYVAPGKVSSVVKS